MTYAQIGQMAWQALMDEVDTTPKPGLVDNNNNGAHQDMTYATFEASANALRPHFKALAQVGGETARREPEEAFALMRQLGQAAEEDMYAATDGVNTHKGAIFALGLLCGAAGRSIGQNLPPTPIRLCRTIKSMTRNLCRRDYALPVDCNRRTGGQRAFLKYGVTGARGEAESGYASVKDYGYPRLQSLLKAGDDVNTARVRTLLCLMAHVTDTNILSRHDMATALEIKARAAALHRRFSMEGTLALDELMIGRNISPGGCADLLAATLLMYSLRHSMGENLSAGW